jgi:LPXTG-site transpeptidase (sortase) family protein
MSKKVGKTGSRRRGGWAVAMFERCLWLAAIGFLGTALWMKSDSLFYQFRADRELDAAIRSLGAESASKTSPASDAPAVRVQLAPGTPLARLTVPRLDVGVVVAEGIDDRVLQRALGHVPTSARPGEAGNVALAGHRDTHFRFLEQLRVGDEMILESVSGRDVYRVEWAVVVEPHQVELVEESGYAALTLVTCYPFRYVGNAPYRYVIRARKVDSSGAPGTAHYETG